MITAEELICRCRRTECDAPAPDPVFVEQLQAMEQRLGEAITVTSGVRCRYWNEHEGGTKNSGHLRRTEADLACTTGPFRFKLLQAALSAGFARLGIGKTFLHVGGISSLPQSVIWHYYAVLLALVGSLFLAAPALSLAEGPAFAQVDVVDWQVLRNGLVELQLDTNGDGIPDRTELHVVARSGRTVLTDRQLDAQAQQDRLWLFVVEADDGRFIYWVAREPLTLCDSTCTGRTP